MDQSDLHNQMVGKIVSALIKPVLENGGSAVDVLVLTESVVAGVVTTLSRIGGDTPAADAATATMTDLLFDGIRRRIGEQRLATAEPAGRA